MPRLLALVALLLGLAVPASAQSVSRWATPVTPSAAAPPDPGDGPSTPDPPPQSIPLDGGLGLLALAGGAYGVRRLRQR